MGIKGKKWGQNNLSELILLSNDLRNYFLGQESLKDLDLMCYSSENLRSINQSNLIGARLLQVGVLAPGEEGRGPPFLTFESFCQCSLLSGCRSSGLACGLVNTSYLSSNNKWLVQLRTFVFKDILKIHIIWILVTHNRKLIWCRLTGNIFPINCGRGDVLQLGTQIQSP